jgi:hypothetical protein
MRFALASLAVVGLLALGGGCSKRDNNPNPQREADRAPPPSAAPRDEAAPSRTPPPQKTPPPSGAPGTKPAEPGNP